jgi:hypothetical protein
MPAHIPKAKAYDQQKSREDDDSCEITGGVDTVEDEAIGPSNAATEADNAAISGGAATRARSQELSHSRQAR